MLRHAAKSQWQELEAAGIIHSQEQRETNACMSTGLLAQSMGLGASRSSSLVPGAILDGYWSSIHLGSQKKPVLISLTGSAEAATE